MVECKFWSNILFSDFGKNLVFTLDLVKKRGKKQRSHYCKIINSKCFLANSPLNKHESSTTKFSSKKNGAKRVSRLWRKTASFRLRNDDNSLCEKSELIREWSNIESTNVSRSLKTKHYDDEVLLIQYISTGLQSQRFNFRDLFPNCSGWLLLGWCLGSHTRFVMMSSQVWDDTS